MNPRRRFEWAELAELRALAAMERTPRGALKAVAAKYGRCYECASKKVFRMRFLIQNPPPPKPRGPETFAELMMRLTAEHEGPAG